VYRELESEGFYLPLTELYCHYLKPARYDDVIRIETSINYFRRASIKFDYEIWDERRDGCLVEDRRPTPSSIATGRSSGRPGLLQTK